MKPVVFSVFFLLLTCTSCGSKAPEAPQGPSGAAWGEAVLGLALRLEAPKTTYGAEEAMVFQVEVKNLSDAPLRLPFLGDLMWHYKVRFENLEDGVVFVGGSGLFVDFAEPPDVTLAPGATWSEEADLSEERRRYLRIIPNRKPGDDWDYRDHLPPGRWRASLEYGRATESREGLWKGTARSNELEITVADGA